MLWSNYSDASLTIQESQIELLSVLQMQYTVHHTHIAGVHGLVCCGVFTGSLVHGPHVVFSLLDEYAYYEIFDEKNIATYEIVHFQCNKFHNSFRIIIDQSVVVVERCDQPTCCNNIIWSYNYDTHTIPLRKFTIHGTTYYAVCGVVIECI